MSPPHLSRYLAAIVMMIVGGCIPVSSQGVLSLPSSPQAGGFLENRGQVIDDARHPRPDVAFSMSRGGVSVFLRRSGVSYVFSRSEPDTATGPVGESSPFDPERRWPPPAPGDAVTGYRARIRLLTDGLFVHRAIDRATGAPARMTRGADGMLTIGMPGAGVVTGESPVWLELEGLSTADPLNAVGLASMELEGLGELPVAGSGLVILSGCDVGRDFLAGKRVSMLSVTPHPIVDAATVVYRAPAGAMPELALIDVGGRQVLLTALPAGTGADQTAVVEIGEISSGIYRLELRDGSERVGFPVILVR